MTADPHPLRRCPRCGAEWPAEGPPGHCPRCTLSEVLACPPDEPGTDTLALDDIPAPGQRVAYIGDYELLDLIAHGGMGVVYRARQRSLNRLVALKLLLGGIHASEEFKRRFRQEAETAARLHHPHIVTIHEIGEHRGQPYYSMELVAGPDLGRLTRANPLPPAQAVRYVKAAAEAVQYAHGQGVLHRDLKPGNVLIGPDDRPRITDFGLAKVSGSATDSTVTGETLGTPAFLPPEQVSIQHGAVGPFSDVYALGGVLYQVLTGRPPFAAGSAAEILAQVLAADPAPPRLVNPAVPRDLETICLKCLEKNPQRRYGTARDLADDLARWQNGEPIRARPVSAWERTLKWGRKRPAVVALLALLVLAVGAGYGSTVRQWRRAEGASRRAEKFLYASQVRLAMQQAGETHHQEALVAVAAVVEDEPTYEPGTAALVSTLSQLDLPWPKFGPYDHPGASSNAVNTLAFSPDGRYLFTASERGPVYAWPVGGGAADTNPTPGQSTLPQREAAILQPALTLDHSVKVTALALSPDGQRLATTAGSNQVWLWAFPSGRLVTNLPAAGPVQALTFSPNSRFLGVATAAGTAQVVEAQTGANPRELRGHTGPVLTLVFTPDSGRLTTRGGDVRVWDITTGAMVRPPLTVEPPPAAFAFNEQGSRVATVSTDGTLRVWAMPSGDLVSTIPATGAGDVALSPNGRIAATPASRYPAGSIRLWDVERGVALTPELAYPREVRSLAFSPDGLRLALCLDDNTVRVLDALSGEPLCEPIRGSVFTRQAAWSRDGHLLAAPLLAGQTMVWDVGWSRALPLHLPPRQVREVQWDPRGDRVLTASRDGTAQLWNARTGGPLSDPLAHDSPVTVIRFSPDGRRFLTASSNGVVRLWSATDNAPQAAALPHDAPLCEARFDARSRRLFTAAKNGQLHVWEVGTGKLLARTQSAMATNAYTFGPVRHAEFGPLATRIVLACADHRVRIWEWTTGQSDRVLLSHDGPVWDCRISPDGQRLATASLDGTALLVEFPGGRPLAPPIRHQGELSCVAFSPDGRILLTASWDGTARLWDGQTGAALGPVLKHSMPIQYAEFSPDGHRIVTASMDSTARVWDAATGLPLTVPLRHPARVHFAGFSPDGQRVLTDCYDWIPRIWDVPAPAGEAPRWLSKLAEVCAGQRVNGRGMIEEVPASALAPLEESLRANTATDPISTWGRWFVADRATRTISPLTTQTLAEYVEGCLADGTIPRLREAVRIAPGNAVARTRLLEALAGEATRQTNSTPPAP